MQPTVAKFSRKQITLNELAVHLGDFDGILFARKRATNYKVFSVPGHGLQ